MLRITLVVALFVTVTITSVNGKETCEHALKEITEKYFFNKEAGRYTHESPEFKEIVNLAFNVGKTCTGVMSMSKAVKSVLKGHLNLKDKKENHDLDLKFTLFIRFMKAEAEEGTVVVNQAIKDDKSHLIREMSSKMKYLHDKFNSAANKPRGAIYF